MINQNIFYKDWHAKLICISNNCLIFEIESLKESAVCPICGERSERVHSSYFRTLNDLPVFNYKVILRIRTRKFFCDNVHCKQKTFAEKLKGLAKRYSRRTSRLDDSLIKFAMTSSAEATYRIMKETVLCISPNTLIRLVRNYVDSTEDKSASKYIGIDDWAIKKRKTYGTLICDLITQKPIDVLPGRDAETLSAWLDKHSDILLVSRDRSNVYAGAVTSSLPDAVQAADRWHLLKNVFDAILQYINTKYPNGYLLKEEENNDVNQNKDTNHIEDKEIEPEIKIKYQAERQANHIKKVQKIQNVKKLFSEGYNISQISEKMDLDWKTVKTYIKMESMPTVQQRKSINIATPYLDWISQK